MSTRTSLALPLVFASFWLVTSAASQPAPGAAVPPAAPTASETAPLPPPPAAPPSAATTAPAAAEPPVAPPASGAPPAYGYPPSYGYPPPYGPAAGYPGYGYPPGAYGPPPPPPPPKPPTRNVSLTLSPIHLLFPFVELMGEVRLADHVSAAAIGGYGEVSVETWPAGTVKVSVYELGGQLAAYPLGAFDGLQLGAEVLYAKAKADNLSGDVAQAAANGLAVGPFVGYKLVTSGGFTFLAQGGFEYIAMRAEGADSNGTTTTDASESRMIPLLNLNIGWSF